MTGIDQLTAIHFSPRFASLHSLQGKVCVCVVALSMMSFAHHGEMRANNISAGNQQKEVVTQETDIISNIQKRTGVSLPTVYNQKLKTFITTNKIMKDKGSAQFTEDYIVKQMQSDWGISKQSQLLFIWTHIYNEITGKYLYDGSDGDENRLDEYGNVMERAEKCGKDFRSGYIAYTKEISAEARQQSAEARQQSAEARQQSAEARQQSAEAVKGIMKQDSLRVKERMVEFYDIYLKNPRNIKQDDLNFMKKSTKEFIADCKKYGINYKAILLKEVGDKKKVDNILKFYGIEYR